MKKLNSLFSKLCLAALLSLPLAFASCSDDDNTVNHPNAPVIEDLGVENSITLAKGESLKIEPVLNIDSPVDYSWTLNDENVSIDKSYTFEAKSTGTFEIIFKASNESGTAQTTITIKVIDVNAFFVINEGKYGTPASAYYYNGESWADHYITGLGQTGTVGVIQGAYMYIVAKEAPYLSQVNLSNLSINKQLSAEIDDKLDNGQANNFCVINENEGILAASRGAYKVTLNPLALGEMLPGLNSTEANGNGCKDLIKTDDYVFINNMGTIKVYKTSDLSFVKDLESEMTTGFTQSKDGNVWAANEGDLIKINAKTLAVETISLPDGYVVNYNSMAYTPTCLCASTSENAIFFVKKDGWSSKEAYKFNIDSQSLTKVMTANDGYNFYGAGLAVNPYNGNVYGLFNKSYQLDNQIMITNGNSDAVVKLINYSEANSWFPSSITFDK